MPKLKLDIFGDTPARTENPPSSLETQNQDHLEKSHLVITSAPMKKVESREAPHFIPVGFYEEHLHILDEAVLKQRRRGNWKASKSAIIRGLIERHQEELKML